MLNVFIVALVSWGIYCIEYLVYKGLVKEDELNELTQLAKNNINKKKDTLISLFFLITLIFYILLRY